MKQWVDHHMGLCGGVRKELGPSILTDLSWWLRRSVIKEFKKRGYRQLKSGRWVNETPHWSDCKGIGDACTCWRKQCGYAHWDSE